MSLSAGFLFARGIAAVGGEYIAVGKYMYNDFLWYVVGKIDMMVPCALELHLGAQTV